ncbi:MAG: hypothetical protein P4L40_11850 [Terracidiphilus sp.]|nr:hypothetical protein [Terracidiphilus sp.]
MKTTEPQSMIHRWRVLRPVSLFAGVIAVVAVGAGLHGQIAVRNQGFVPYSDAPIRYQSDQVDDPVARLQRRMDAGHVHLEWTEKGGYLQSVLRKLHIPVSSQTLVFSKTSFQYKMISPATPRALYFNDDVYVGFVNNGRVLELVSFDAQKGAIYYLLDAKKQEHPVFERAELDCTQCHVSSGTRGVPGVLLRSVYTTATGTQAPYTASPVTGQETPLRERWGGWYVTGTHGRQQHMGNVTVSDTDHPEALNVAAGANVTSLAGRFDSASYLSDQSDIVAHLVLGHQTQMHNLITLANYQSRIALYRAEQKVAIGAVDAPPDFHKTAEELLRYLLFANEAPLSEDVRGTTSFVDDFAALGPRDRRGRSLRDFDLHTRIFRYPCSYLIYSSDLDALPETVKSYLYHRLHQILTGEDQSPDFARLTIQDRKAIREILLDTKPGLPAEWHQTHSQQLHAHLELGRRQSVLATN